MSLRRLVTARKSMYPTFRHGYSRSEASRKLAKLRQQMLARGKAVVRRTRRYAGVAPELKYQDQLYAPATLVQDSWAGCEIDPAAKGCIGGCVQGNGESERDGVRTIMKTIRVTGVVKRPIANDQPNARAGGVVWVALVLDTQTNGVQLSSENVYRDFSSCVPPFRVVEDQARYKILGHAMVSMHDVVATVDGANTCSLGGYAAPFEINWKGSIPVNYVSGAGAGTVADIKDNSFHVIAAEEGGVADTIEYNVRCRWVG